MGRWRNWQTPVLEPSVQYGAGALHADVAKLADALGLGPSARKGMSVRLRPSAFEGFYPVACAKRGGTGRLPPRPPLVRGTQAFKPGFAAPLLSAFKPSIIFVQFASVLITHQKW